jgi:hypothetical protein
VIIRVRRRTNHNLKCSIWVSYIHCHLTALPANDKGNRARTSPQPGTIELSCARSGSPACSAAREIGPPLHTAPLYQWRSCRESVFRLSPALADLLNRHGNGNCTRHPVPIGKHNVVSCELFVPSCPIQPSKAEVEIANPEWCPITDAEYLEYLAISVGSVPADLDATDNEFRARGRCPDSLLFRIVLTAYCQAGGNYQTYEHIFSHLHSPGQRPNVPHHRARSRRPTLMTYELPRQALRCMR